jgi:biotin carboxylase
MAEKQKSVFIVAAGEMQIPAIKTAKDMGFFVIASDKDPDAAGFKYADIPLVLNTKDVDAHIKFALKNKEKYNIAGAFAAADVAVTVSAITNALNLPGIPNEVAFASNNKAEMKKRWLRDGVPTPYSIEVSTVEEAKRVIDKIGEFPVMIKAVDNAASRGSKKIISFDELPDAIEDAKNNSTTRTALVEEFVEGKEYSVETVVFKGVHYHYGMGDRIFGFAPYAIEIGHIDPSRLSMEEQDEINKVVDRAADSLGITFGPAKADAIVTKKGPMVLEMPARLSGGWHSQYTTPLATGRDPIRDVINISTGGSMSIENTIPKFNNVSICKAVFPKPGKVIKISGVKEAEQIAGVAKIIMVVKEGENIREYHNCGNRVCYIITVGKDEKEAFKIWDKAVATIKFEII